MADITADITADVTADVTADAAIGADPGRSRFHARVLRDGSTLYWWVEVVLIAAFYLVYSVIRNANEGGEAQAFANAQQIIGWERALGLYFEEAWQNWALHAKPFVVAMNYFYGSLHFLVTAGAIVWLFRRHPNDYPRMRNTLAITTGLALIGFITWPLMPPRLLPESYSFVDTLARYPTIWSFNSGSMQELSNQFAAMPSLHFGWSLFCAAALAPRMERRGLRVAFGLYPALTLVAIVVTGNHFWLDAVGGAVIFGAGYFLAHRFTRAGRPVRDDVGTGTGRGARTGTRTEPRDEPEPQSTPVG